MYNQVWMMDFEIKIDKVSSTPVYLQIKQHLLHMIEEKGLGEDAMMPNVKKVAEAAGVSLRTADQAMQALIADGMCYRRPKKGTFVRGRNHTAAPRKICGIWGNGGEQAIHGNLLFARLYRGISQCIGSRDFEATLLFDDPERSLRLYEGIDSFDFRGLLIIDIRNYERALKLASRFPDKKFVFLNYRIKGINQAPPNIYSIVNDDFGGAYRLTEYFISRGLRKFLIFSWRLPDPDDLTYRERVQGYCRAARDYGINLNPEQDIIECTDADSARQGAISYLEARKCLRMRKEELPEIIFATNDFMAEGIKRCIDDEGLGDRVRVAGYDCLFRELAIQNHFSSVEVKYDAMSGIAVDLINSDGGDFPRIIKVDPTLSVLNNS